MSYSNKGKKTESGTSAQCNGTTKAGARCRKNTKDESGFCYLHQSQSGGGNNANRDNVEKRSETSSQCNGTTKKGSRCRRMTRNPSGYCYQHGGN